jgi:glycosyltransferase involved in cell wall biosynthesis
MTKKKILIYNDCRQWGGHELMTIEMANALTGIFDVYFCYFNDKFEKHLLPGVKKIKIPVRSRLSYGGMGSFDFKDVRFLVDLFKDISPSFIVVSQGVIELGLKALWAAKIAGIRVVSYIPLCFPFSLMNAPWAGIRDVFGSLYYKIFDAFITISEEQLSYLRQKASHQETYILENPMTITSGMHRPLRKTAPQIPTIGIIGRINFLHKGQDRVIQTARCLRARGKKVNFDVVGDGEDKTKLERLIQENSLENSFVIKKWSENKKRIYSNLDGLLITSHFEGVPLVLLESIAFNKPVFAPLKGVFPEYLPRDFLYSSSDELTEKLAKFGNYWALWRKQGKRIFKDMARKHDRRNYRKNLISIMGSLDPAGVSGK